MNYPCKSQTDETILKKTTSIDEHQIRRLLLLLSSSVESDSVRPHRQKPTRLLHPWDFPGKSTGVGCHCLLQIRRLNQHNASGSCDSFWVSGTEDYLHYFLEICAYVIISTVLYSSLTLVWAQSLAFSKSAQSLSWVRLFGTPWTAAHQASLSISNSQSLVKLMPSSQWWHSTIWSSVVPFSSCLQCFPASGSFLMSQFFPSGGQHIGEYSPKTLTN